jgi:hypothetical protein
MMKRSLFIFIFTCVVAATLAQNLDVAGGWPKDHGDLKNSGIHPFANGLRSLENANVRTPINYFLF